MPAFSFGADKSGRACHPVIGRSHGTGHLPLFPQPSGYKEPAPGP
jgi:hypothetical protein